ncbi:MAG: hypothetical protein DMH00_07225 [Acidobacteria bacterium]|nr:MAG: hypothetical protein DMH00_07225 [Acidobacteriota bacterium]
MSPHPSRGGLKTARFLLAPLASLGLLLAPGCGGQSTSTRPPPPETSPEQKQKSALLVQRGLRFLADDLGGEAVRTLEEARRLDPASAEAALSLARAYDRENRFAAATKLLQEVLSSEGFPQASKTRAREALVEVRLDSGDLTGARETCRTLLSEGPPSARARRLAGQVAYRAGDLPAALAELKAATLQSPQDPEAQTALGLAQLQGGDLPAAASSLEQAVRLDPASQMAVSNLAKVYERMGRSAEAQNALARYREIYALKSVRQKVGPLRAQAMEAYEAGRLEEALAKFQEVARLTPRDAQALAQVGSVLLALQRLDEARDHLERALRIQPAYDFALTELARVQALREDLPAAVELLQRAIRANPAAPEPHYFLAGIYLAQGRREDFTKEREAYLHLRGAAGVDRLQPLPGGNTP